jgi:hypothetical protein
MANALYDFGRQGFLDGSINWSTDSIKVMLVNTTSYAVNLGTHQFVSDVAGAAIVQRSAALASKTVNSPVGGVADAADITFSAVTDSTVGALIIYKDTGTDATSRLIAYLDTVQGGGALSVTPNGGDITIQWDSGANRIFKL